MQRLRLRLDGRDGRGGDADLGREPRWEVLTRHRPAWADGVLVRRLLALGLTVLAAVLFVRGDPSARRVDAVVAARDLAPGRILSAEDLRRAPRPADTLPEGAVHDLSALVGATVTGAVRSGEILTDLRVVGPRLAQVATGVTDARIVPIRLADNAIADILRAGDRVDVIAAPHTDADLEGPAPPQTLATDAAVVLVTTSDKTRGQGERAVLVALDAAHATTVAAASLRSALTVTFH
ncbi:SAF domain-containing protein [Nocardia transvalensis]|uniref:SAF domain-containing protein n=1 Tax=Nocardia transvalensis TaxID=37333 RepID=UPI001893F0BB|nr:SAF domain-containing protein [Nocardia transvalensis]MBF6330591.1 flagella basal body P-ring formation protein FlgA [Nocardia transvalensis]